MQAIMKILILAAFAAQILAHTWNEQMDIIKDGKFVGAHGYPRGYISRTAPDFDEENIKYLLPSLESTRTKIDGTDLLCHPNQRKQTQSDGYPRLKAAPGDYVAMKYLENGHVTLPWNQLGKPEMGGTVFVYGTTDPKEDEKITNVLKWNTAGTGGDKRGVLLAAQNFDDGRCYQINSESISMERQQKYPNPIPGQPGSTSEQWCETDVQLPSNLQSGETYTLYWIWQWPTIAGVDPGLPDGKDEYYSTCSDFDIGSSSTDTVAEAAANPLDVQDPQTKANPNWHAREALMINAENQGYQAYSSGQVLPTTGLKLAAGNPPKTVESSSAAPTPKSSSVHKPVPTSAPSNGTQPSRQMHTYVFTTIMTVVAPVRRDDTHKATDPVDSTTPKASATPTTTTTSEDFTPTSCYAALGSVTCFDSEEMPNGAKKFRFHR